jgi:hypothetical protein
MFLRHGSRILVWFFSILDPASRGKKAPVPGSQIRNTAKNYFELSREIGRGGHSSALFIDWSVNCGYSGCSGFLLERQVLPNQADCVNRSCSQPHQLINKAVIILIGNNLRPPGVWIRITSMLSRIPSSSS